MYNDTIKYHVRKGDFHRNQTIEVRLQEVQYLDSGDRRTYFAAFITPNNH
jgi:hypothetical protein